MNNRSHTLPSLMSNFFSQNIRKRALKLLCQHVHGFNQELDLRTVRRLHGFKQKMYQRKLDSAVLCHSHWGHCT